MKKNYFLGLLSALMLTFIVTPAKADVTSMVDLFGTYKFTASLEVLDNSYADLFKNEAEVTIFKESGSFYDAAILGIGGATMSQYVSSIDTKNNTFVANNPNSGNGLWSGAPVYVSNAEGKNPYGTIQRDFEFVYTYNPETKEITLPDFTVVTVTDWEIDEAKIVAKFSNVKMTLVKAETVEIADLTGDWQFTSSNYDEESTFPHEFAVSLNKTSDDNKNYDVTFNIEGYDAVTTTAQFDGASLLIAYDSLYLDKENNIFFANYSGYSLEGTYDFSYNSATSMSLTSGMSFVKRTVGKDEEGNDKIESEQIQWFGAALLKLPSDAPAFDWTGRYTATGQRIEATTGYEDVCPDVFDFVVEYSDKWGIYLVTEFMGNDVTDLNSGGIEFNIAEDGMSATLDAGTYISMYSESPMVFLCLYNSAGGTEPAINITRGEDGKITMEPIFVQAVNYDDYAVTPIAFYQNIVLTKESVPSFEWAGSFDFTSETALVDTLGCYANDFNVQIVFSEYNSTYYVTTFLGCDAASMTYGGLPLTISEDGKSATMAISGNFGTALIGGEYPDYIQLCDVNGGLDPLTFTVEDGVLKLSDFALYSYNYDSGETSKLATYSSVVGSPIAVENYNWAGKYVHSIFMDEDAWYADVYEMEIAYEEYNNAYYLTKFMNCELGSLNNGGLMLTVSDEDPSKATVKLNGAYGVALLDMLENGNYLQLVDADGNGVSLELTLGADGVITIAPYKVVEFSFGEFAAVGEPVAYPQSTAVKGGATTDIDAPIENVVDDKIDLNSDQPVDVYDTLGRKVYTGAASEISNIAKGLYIVKSGNASMKLYVK